MDQAAAIVLGPALLAVAHAATAAARGGGASGAGAIFLLGVALALAGAGMAALGRALACPAPASGACAVAVLWLACGGVWWADRLAERVPAERRHDVRQAVLRLDPLTAAAYDAAGHDRLHDRAVYSGTTVATTTVLPPAAPDTALLWGFTGLACAAAAWAARPRGAPKARP